MEKFDWITINYHLPVSPSGNRVYVWRKLKETGAEYLRQGVALLPSSKENLQKAQQLATKIRAMDGEATVTEMRFVEEADHIRMVETFKAQSKDEYKDLLLETAQLYRQMGDKEISGSKALHKRYMKAKSRDYFDAEAEISNPESLGTLFSELNLDGGWAELCADLRQGYRGLGRLLAGLMPEKGEGQHKTEGSNGEDGR